MALRSMKRARDGAPARPRTAASDAVGPLLSANALQALKFAEDLLLEAHGVPDSGEASAASTAAASHIRVAVPAGGQGSPLQLLDRSDAPLSDDLWNALARAEQEYRGGRSSSSGTVALQRGSSGEQPVPAQNNVHGAPAAARRADSPVRENAGERGSARDVSGADGGSGSAALASEQDQAKNQSAAASGSSSVGDERGTVGAQAASATGALTVSGMAAWLKQGKLVPGTKKVGHPRLQRTVTAVKPFVPDPEIQAARKRRIAERKAAEDAERARVDAEAAERAARLRGVAAKAVADSRASASTSVGSASQSAEATPRRSMHSHTGTSERANPYALGDWDARIRPRSYAYNMPARSLQRPGKEVTYWVTGVLRVRDNWALRHALQLSRLLRLPVVALIVLPPRMSRLAAAINSSRKLPDLETGDAKHLFRASAAAAMQRNLAGLRVPLVGIVANPEQEVDVMRRWIASRQSHIVITDEGYDPAQMSRVHAVADGLPCAVYSVDCDCVVPVRYRVKGPQSSKAAAATELEPLAAPSLPAALRKSREFWEFGRDIEAMLPQVLSRMNWTPLTTDEAPLEDLQAGLYVRDAVGGDPLDRIPAVPDEVADVYDRVVWKQWQTLAQTTASAPGGLCGAEEVAKSCLDRVLRGPLCPGVDDEATGGGFMAIRPFVQLGSISPLFVVQCLSRPGMLLGQRPAESQSAADRVHAAGPGNIASFGDDTLRRWLYLLVIEREFHLRVVYPRFSESRRVFVRARASITAGAGAGATAAATSLPAPTVFHFQWWGIVPSWVKRDLQKHKGDSAARRCMPRKMGLAETHDRMWNAIQRRIGASGSLHPLLREYWAACMISFTPVPSRILAMCQMLLETHSRVGATASDMAAVVCDVFGMLQPAPPDTAPERAVTGRLATVGVDEVRELLDDPKAFMSS